MARVACLGECMMELTERADGLLARRFGGDTLNTAVYLARLGVETSYVTALGTDPFSDEMVRLWEEEGIDASAVLRVPGALPGLYLIQTDAAGERRFHYWRESAPVRRLFTLPQAPHVQARLAEAEMIYLSGVTLSLFDEASRSRLFETLRAARRGGASVAFDTNFRSRGWPDPAAARTAYDRMLAGADLVLASVEDCLPVYGADAPAELIEMFRNAGVKEIVVKLAHPACHVALERLHGVVAAEPVSGVVDTTAAGDSFAAAYITARLSGAGPEVAARAGHRLAGEVVRHPGAIIPRSAMPAADAQLAAAGAAP